VNIAGTLVLTDALTNVTDINSTLWSYVGSGEALEVSVTSAVPSSFSSIVVQTGKSLVTATSANESADTLTVPAGVVLTTSGTFTTLTDDITVSGTFNATALTVADDKTLTVTGTLNAPAGLTVTGTVVIGSGSNTVTLDKAMVSGGTASGSTATLTIPDTETLVLADTGTIVVAGTGKVATVHTEFGAGTYRADDEVTISSLTGADTIITTNVGNKGLVVGTSGNTLSLLASTTTITTYTITSAAGQKVRFGNGANAVKVGHTTPRHQQCLVRLGIRHSQDRARRNSRNRPWQRRNTGSRLRRHNRGVFGYRYDAYYYWHFPSWLNRRSGTQ
jgi:hypothetical protein